MIECLGLAYRKPFADSESEEEPEEGMEDTPENRQRNSMEIQDYMASQAQMIAPRKSD